MTQSAQTTTAMSPATGVESDVPFDDLDRRLRDLIERIKIDVQTPSPYNEFKHFFLEEAVWGRKIRRRFFELDRVLEGDAEIEARWAAEDPKYRARMEAIEAEEEANKARMEANEREYRAQKEAFEQECAASREIEDKILRGLQKQRVREEAIAQAARQEALAQMPKPPHKTRPATDIKRMEQQTGKTVISYTRDGERVTYTFADGTQQQLSDTDREWAEFEARHNET